MIVHPWQQAPASVFCKDQTARQSARDACLARGSFVDSAGRGMVEYGHGRMGVAGVGVHEACNRAPPTLADIGVEFAANAFWMF